MKRIFLFKMFLSLVTVVVFDFHELKSVQEKNQQEFYPVRWMYASPQLETPLEFIFTDPQPEPGCDRISLRKFVFNNLKQRWFGSKEEQRPVQVICVDPRPVKEVSVSLIERVENWIKENIGNRFVKHLEYRDRHERLERSVSPESFKEDMKGGLVGVLHMNKDVNEAVNREAGKIGARIMRQAKAIPVAKKSFFEWDKQKISIPKNKKDENMLSGSGEAPDFFKGVGQRVEKGKQYVSAGFEKIKNALEKFKNTHPIAAVDQNTDKDKGDKQVGSGQSATVEELASTPPLKAAPLEPKTENLVDGQNALRQPPTSHPSVVDAANSSGVVPPTLTDFEKNLGLGGEKEKTFFSHISENPATAVAVTVGSVVAVYGVYKLFVYLHAQKAERIALKKRLKNSLKDRSCVVL